MDIDFQTNGMTFDLWRLKFGGYNWTARHADGGLATNVKRQPELQEVEVLNYCQSSIRFLLFYKVSSAFHC